MFHNTLREHMDGFGNRTKMTYSKEGACPLDWVLLTTCPNREQKYLTNKQA